MHAEATSEKVAMGHWLDGRASMIFGTHTHIPTADAKILPGGSAFISDLGMCGPYDSVLGRRKDRVVKYMTTNMPHAVRRRDRRRADVRGARGDRRDDRARRSRSSAIEVQGDNADQAYDADDKSNWQGGGHGGGGGE